MEREKERPLAQDPEPPNDSGQPMRLRVRDRRRMQRRRTIVFVERDRRRLPDRRRGRDRRAMHQPPKTRQYLPGGIRPPASPPSEKKR